MKKWGNNGNNGNTVTVPASYLEALIGIGSKGSGGGRKGGKGKGKGGGERKGNRWSRNGNDPPWACHLCGLEHHDPMAPKCHVCQTPREESKTFMKIKDEISEKDKKIQSLQDKLKAAENHASNGTTSKGKGIPSGAEAGGSSGGTAAAGSLSSLVSSD